MYAIRSYYETAGSNAQEVIEGCLKVLEQSKVSFPKGVEYASLVNANRNNFV